MPSCNAPCVSKALLITVNIIVFLIALGLIGMGGFLLAAGNHIQPEVDDILDDVAKLGDQVGFNDTTPGHHADVDGSEIVKYLHKFGIPCVVVGVFMVVLATLGCCGAFCGKIPLLAAYIIFLLIILILQIVGGVFSIGGHIEEPVRDYMNETLADYGGLDTYNVESVSWNFAMFNFECCGIDNYNDFKHAPKWKKERMAKDGSTITLKTPVACCITDGDFPKATIEDPKCITDPTKDNSNYETGCLKKLNDKLHEYRDHFIGSFVAMCVLEAFLIICACIVIHHERKKGKGEY